MERFFNIAGPCIPGVRRLAEEQICLLRKQP